MDQIGVCSDGNYVHSHHHQIFAGQLDTNKLVSRITFRDQINNQTKYLILHETKRYETD